MNKQPDDPIPLNNPPTKGTTDAGNAEQNSADAVRPNDLRRDPNPEDFLLPEGDSRIATAEDFRKDWEKRGKPTSALESLFEIDKDLSWINRNYLQSLGAMESLKDVDHLSRLAAVYVEPLPFSLDVTLKEQAYALKALDEITGASTSLDSVLKLQAQFLEATKVSEELSRAIFDSRRLPLLQDMTDALSLSAIRYIRESSPVVPPREIKPPRIKPITTTPKPEVAKGGPAAIPPKQGPNPLDVAAEALSQLDAVYKVQTAIVRSSKEWDMLNQMKSNG